MNEKEVNSTVAGGEILRKWSRINEWNKLFGSDGSSLFGMVMWVTLFDDDDEWVVQQTENGRIYSRSK